MQLGKFTLTAALEQIIFAVFLFIYMFFCFYHASIASTGATNRQPEESTAGGATATTLPGQFKQRAPMYNASTASPTVPTSPTTPTSTPHNNAPPTAATATQPDTATPPSTTAAQATPTPAPQQPQPKKNLSLTVRTAYCTSFSPSPRIPRAFRLSLFVFILFCFFLTTERTDVRRAGNV